jgi:atypical dual specificity phosphatase
VRPGANRAAARPPRRAAAVLAWLLGRGDWVEEGRVLACAYPRTRAALANLARQRVTTVVNLHPRAHAAARLARYGLVELHLPVADFSPPSPEQIDRGVAAIADAVARGERVAVHCGAGLGRTGTLLACYLVRQGLDPAEAIARVRAARPGAIETAAQEAAVRAEAARLRGSLEAASAT